MGLQNFQFAKLIYIKLYQWEHKSSFHKDEWKWGNGNEIDIEKTFHHSPRPSEQHLTILQTESPYFPISYLQHKWRKMRERKRLVFFGGKWRERGGAYYKQRDRLRGEEFRKLRKLQGRVLQVERCIWWWEGNGIWSFCFWCWLKWEKMWKDSEWRFVMLCSWLQWVRKNKEKRGEAGKGKKKIGTSTSCTRTCEKRKLQQWENIMC